MHTEIDFIDFKVQIFCSPVHTVLNSFILKHGMTFQHFTVPQTGNPMLDVFNWIADKRTTENLKEITIYLPEVDYKAIISQIKQENL